MSTQAPVPLPAIPSWLVEAAKNANLPTLLLGPAGAAISRLIGGATDIPAAWLQAKADEIRANSAGRQKVSSDLANAAGARAIAQDELVERALASFLPEHLRKQSNKEAVARAAVEALADSANDCDEPEEPAEPDADWMNMFIRFAEDASSDRMRDLWGRVLAKEIQHKGSFSMRTIRFMSELDLETAKSFERVSQLVFAGDGVDLPENLTHAQFHDVFLLEQAGLLSHGSLARYFPVPEEGVFGVQVGEGDLVLHGTPGKEIGIGCAILTTVGVEVMRIVPRETNRSLAMSIADRFQKTHLTKIEWDATCSGEVELVWSKDD